MIEAEIVYSDVRGEELKLIREQVNDPTCIGDSKDLDSYHVIVYDSKEPVATGRLQFTNSFIIDKVCVRSNKRNEYFGDLVVKMLLDKAFTLSAQKVVIYATKFSVGFFERIGFTKDENQTCCSNDLVKMIITKAAIKKCSL